MSNINKDSLRKYYLTLRNNISDRENKNNDIFLQVTNNSKCINADVLFCYISCKGEVDTLKIIDYFLKKGKKVACPKCLDDKGNMDFYYIKSTDDLKSGSFNVPEPDLKCEKAKFSENSVCLVPCVCADDKLYRVGYGKGYYDRFLDKFTGTKMLLCFSDCVCEMVSYDIYDIKCDLLIKNR